MGGWSGKKTHVVVSAYRREQELDTPNWRPQEKQGMLIKIRSDKGESVVRAWLSNLYKNVAIHLVYGIPGMPNHREYLYRVW